MRITDWRKIYLVNKYLNNILIQMSKILGCTIGVIENSGTVISSGISENVEKNVSKIVEMCAESKNKLVKNNIFLLKSERW